MRSEGFFFLLFFFLFFSFFLFFLTFFCFLSFLSTFFFFLFPSLFVAFVLWLQKKSLFFTLCFDLLDHSFSWRSAILVYTYNTYSDEWRSEIEKNASLVCLKYQIFDEREWFCWSTEIQQFTHTKPKGEFVTCGSCIWRKEPHWCGPIRCHKPKVPWRHCCLD